MQGDKDMYTVDNLVKRKGLKRNRLIRDVTRNFWDVTTSTIRRCVSRSCPPQTQTSLRSEFSEE